LTAGEFLAALTQLPMGSPNDLTADAPFVVLSPHPDDETLGAGGLLAATCATGQRADVVVVTDGSGSHPRSKAYPPPRLIALRQAEVEAAGALLGLEPDSVRHLGSVLKPLAGDDAE
jgi:LmbE family N-acetylglucosaminyl deacetylase